MLLEPPMKRQRISENTYADAYLPSIYSLLGENRH